MKKLLLAALVLCSVKVFAQKKADDVAKFNVETYDFGKVKADVPVTTTFVVTNIGKDNLIISQAQPSCSCTVGDYTKAPIPPGKTGTITASIPHPTIGQINKTITVKFDGSDDAKFLKLTGEVLSPADYDKAVAAGEIKKADAATDSTSSKKMKKKMMAAKS